MPGDVSSPVLRLDNGYHDAKQTCPKGKMSPARNESFLCAPVLASHSINDYLSSSVTWGIIVRGFHIDLQQAH